MKNAPSIAFNMRRMKKEDEQMPKDEMSHAASIAHAILASKKGYADGGMVEECMADGGSVMDPNAAIEDDSEDMEALSESGDDSLAPVGDPGDEKRKKMLKGILASIRSK